MTSTHKSQRGAALLLVLWALAILSLLLDVLSSSVQLELRQAHWHRLHTQAVLAAQAGVNLAVQALLEKSSLPHWIADGRTVPLQFNGSQVFVAVTSERGKLDLNMATLEDVESLVKACGASPELAAKLSQALKAKYGSGKSAPQVLEELRQIPGMNQFVYSRLLPEVTLWSRLPRPEPAFVSTAMRRALHIYKQTAIGVDPGSIVSIDSRVQLLDGFSVKLYTIVSLTPSESGARPYRVLSWHE